LAVDWAATNHEVSSDGRAYTFHLRRGMTWSDGTPIDASTYAYAINRCEDPCTASPISNNLDPIKGATGLYHEVCPSGATRVTDTLIGTSAIASDPQTLTIILNQPSGRFLTVLTSPTTWAVPQQLIEQFQDKSTNHLADAGGFGGNLFRLTRWDHAGHLALERNERFWGQTPRLRRIESGLYKSADAAWMTFKSGTGDVSSLSNDSDSTVAAADVREARTVKGVTVQQTSLLRLSFLTLDWKRAPFDDVRVRQAFSMATDRQTIAHEIWRHAVQPSTHVVLEGIAGSNPYLADAAGRSGTEARTADADAARRLASAYAAVNCGGVFAQCPQIELAYSNAAGAREMQQWQQAFPGWPTIYVGRGAHWQHPQTPMVIQAGWSAAYPEAQVYFGTLWTADAPYNRSAVTIPQLEAVRDSRSKR
jgi:peptide/nickel transport system substrate-binding protein/oligopeptide transport system substrate-binding protein